MALETLVSQNRTNLTIKIDSILSRRNDDGKDHDDQCCR